MPDQPTHPGLPSAPSILIILMGSMGDVVRGLGLVAHLKEHLPGCRVTWLVEPAWAPLVRAHPAIDRVVVFDRPRGVRGVVALARELRRHRFDATLDLQRHLKSGFFSLLSRARRRLGFHRRDAKEFNWFFNNERIDYVGEGIPKIEHYFRFTARLGLPAPERVDFGFAGPGPAAALPPPPAAVGEGAVVLVMGSSWESKDWHREGYIALAREITGGPGRPVVLVGAPAQAEAARAVAAALEGAPVTDLAGKTSLLELAAVLKTAAAAVGPDSGPGHLAAAVGTPSVTLFGPTDPVRTAPYGCGHLVVRAEVECAPCYRKRCQVPHIHCMRTIPLTSVLAKLDLALAGGPAPVRGG